MPNPTIVPCPDGEWKLVATNVNRIKIKIIRTTAAYHESYRPTGEAAPVGIEELIPFTETIEKNFSYPIDAYVYCNGDGLVRVDDNGAESSSVGPGGNEGNVQYKKGTSFAGKNEFTFDDVTNTVSISDLILINQALLDGIITIDASGKLISTKELPDGTLATTQSIGDVSKKLATCEFATKAVYSLAWRPPVKLKDDVETDAAANIVGQTSYTADGVAVTDGIRLLLTAETTNPGTYKDKVFLVGGVGSAITLTLQLDGKAGDGSPTDGDTLNVKDGTDNEGLTFIYSNGEWVDGPTLTGTLLDVNNLTDVENAIEAFNNISPVTTLGDIISRGAVNNERIAGNTETVKKYLTQLGTGSASTLPIWEILANGGQILFQSDYASLQLAIDAADSGDYVIINKGTTDLGTGALSITKRIKLVGHGKNSDGSIIKSTNTSGVIAFNTASSGINPHQRLEFRGFQLDGQVTATNGFKSSSATINHITISDVEMIDFATYGFFNDASTFDDIIFENCNFLHNVGSHVKAGGAFKNIKFIDCFFNDAGGGTNSNAVGLYMSTGYVQNMLMQRCFMKDSALLGMYIYDDSNNIVIEDSIFLNNGWDSASADENAAIKFSSHTTISDIFIRNCLFDRNGEGCNTFVGDDRGQAIVAIASGAGTVIEKILIEKCTFSRNKHVGFTVYGKGGGVANDNIIVRDCNFLNNGSANGAFGIYTLYSASPAGTVDASNNYWGANDGPSDQGPGNGDAVSLQVTFTNFTQETQIANRIEYDPTSSGLIATQVQAAIDEINLNAVKRDEWLQNGIANKADSTLAFADITRIFTINRTGSSFDYYVQGIKYTVTTDDVVGVNTVTLTDTEGLWAIYYDGATLSAINNPTRVQYEDLIMTKCLVGLVYYDATNNLGILYEERHGISMSPGTHRYLHETRGMAYSYGLGLGNFTIGDGSLDSHAQFSINSGECYDENLPIDLNAINQTTGNIIFYRSSSNWRWTTQTGFKAITFDGTSATRLAYDNAGTLTQVANNKFALIHIFGTNAYDGNPITIIGQNEYNNISEAQAGAEVEINSLVLMNLPSKELKALATIILQTNDSYINGIKSKIVQTSTGDDWIDWRTSKFAAGSGTDFSFLDDYFRLSGRPGGQTASGGNDASDDLTFETTTDPTKGKYKFPDLDEGFVKVNASKELEVVSSISGGLYTPLTLNPIAGFIAPNVIVSSSPDVDSWTDMSFLGSDATQTTAINKPKLVANITNGLHAIDFTRANSEFLTLQGKILENLNDAGNSYTLFAVIKTKTAVSSQVDSILNWNQTTLNNGAFFFAINGNSSTLEFIVGTGTGTITLSYNVANTTAYIVMATFTEGTDGMNLYANSSTTVRDTDTFVGTRQTPNISTYPIQMGRFFNGSNLYTDLYIHESFVYNKLFSATDITNMFNDAAKKYNITLS